MSEWCGLGTDRCGPLYRWVDTWARLSVGRRVAILLSGWYVLVVCISLHVHTVVYEGLRSRVV